jgi:redox-sensitive bicupin YhaK (pirin superfamily)
MDIMLHKAATRGHFDHGWLKTWHTFSFAEYRDHDRIHFGALRVLNDDIVAPGQGFGRHPHDNMEIVTIPLSGALEHRDSMGNSSVIRAGEVQLMSAGTGIFHSEFNHSNDEEVKLLQIWVFPKERNIQPRYAQQAFDPKSRRNSWQTIITPEGEGEMWIHQDAYFNLGTLDEGTALEYRVRKNGNGIYIFIIDGSAAIEGHNLLRRDGAGIWDTAGITLKATGKAEVLLMEVPMKL